MLHRSTHTHGCWASSALLEPVIPVVKAKAEGSPNLGCRMRPPQPRRGEGCSRGLLPFCCRTCAPERVVPRLVGREKATRKQRPGGPKSPPFLGRAAFPPSPGGHFLLETGCFRYRPDNVVHPRGPFDLRKAHAPTPSNETKAWAKGSGRPESRPRLGPGGAVGHPSPAHWMSKVTVRVVVFHC